MLSRSRSALRDLADAPITRHDQLAGAPRRFFKVRGIGRQYLPVADIAAEQADRAHARKLAAQTLVVLGGGGEPDAIVCGEVVPVPQDQHDPLTHIDGVAAKHALRRDVEGAERIAHELVRYGWALCQLAQTLIQGVVRQSAACSHTPILLRSGPLLSHAKRLGTLLRMTETAAKPSLIVHRGGCHCGRVRFEVDAPAVLEVSECNCSICSKSGFLHLIVPRSHFRLLSGTEVLSTYEFNTGTAKHLFCSVCGIKSFYVPRSFPQGYSVNARCLEEDSIERLQITAFDGRDWEHSVALGAGGPGGEITAS